MSTRYLFAAFDGMNFNSAIEQCIFLRLANMADDDGYCYARISTLANLCSCGTTKTRESLREFERLGWLRTTHRFKDDGSPRSSEFKLLIQVAVKVTVPDTKDNVIDLDRSTRDTPIEFEINDTSWSK